MRRGGHVHDHLPAVPLKLHPAMRQLLKPISSSKIKNCGNRMWLKFKKVTVTVFYTSHGGFLQARSLF
jgi:hypothetical protein